MRLFSIILTTLSLVGLVLPIFRKSYWWIRVFDYPKLHIVLLTVISVVLLVRSYGVTNPVTITASLLMIGGLVYHLPKIYKYTPFASVNAKRLKRNPDSNCFRIIQSNIRMDNKEVQLVKQMVKLQNPDILLLVETNNWWVDQLSELNSIFQYSLKVPLENTYGMLLYSKFPLENTEVNYLVKDDIPSLFAKVILPDKSTFDLHCLHPEPPRPGSDTYERDAELLLVGKRIRKKRDPTIVVGDLNDVAWSYTSELFQRYSELIDPREGRGFFNTYNALIPLFRYPLDHFFYSKQFGLIKLEKLKAIGSDHFPMLMDICLEPQHDHSEDQKTADQTDKQEVHEKIEQGKSNN